MTAMCKASVRRAKQNRENEAANTQEMVGKGEHISYTTVEILILFPSV